MLIILIGLQLVSRKNATKFILIHNQVLPHQTSKPDFLYIQPQLALDYCERAKLRGPFQRLFESL